MSEKMFKKYNYKVAICIIKIIIQKDSWAISNNFSPEINPKFGVPSISIPSHAWHINIPCFYHYLYTVLLKQCYQSCYPQLTSVILINELNDRWHFVVKTKLSENCVWLFHSLHSNNLYIWCCTRINCIFGVALD
jgi:hypothetical protein